MTLVLEEPTGLDPWPLLCITAPEKYGKNYQCAAASASPMIGRTIWFAQGEDKPHGFKNVKTAHGKPRFQIARHDGTFRGLHTAMTEAAAVEPLNGLPTLWVLDSGSKLWILIKEMAQAQSDQRWLNRTDKNGNKINKEADIPDTGITITPDQWTNARGQWMKIIRLMQENPGPSIITTRLDEVNVVNGKGEPTGAKMWKMEAHKSLGAEVDGTIELTGRTKGVAHARILGVRSSVYNADMDQVTDFPEFSFDALWRKLGFSEGYQAQVRDHVTSTGEESLAADDVVKAGRDRILAELTAMAIEARVALKVIGGQWFDRYGHPIDETTDLGLLELFRDEVRGLLNIADHDEKIPA